MPPPPPKPEDEMPEKDRLLPQNLEPFMEDDQEDTHTKLPREVPNPSPTPSSEPEYMGVVSVGTGTAIPAKFSAPSKTAGSPSNQYALLERREVENVEKTDIKPTNRGQREKRCPMGDSPGWIPADRKPHVRSYQDGESKRASSEPNMISASLPSTETTVSNFLNQPTADSDFHRLAAAPSFLPEVPAWVTGIFAGVLSFAIVISFVFLLAQVSPNTPWLRKTFQGQRASYTRLRDDDGDHDMFVTLSNLQNNQAPHNDQPPSPHHHYHNRTPAPWADHNLHHRRPRPTNLRVSTDATYSGLGIAVSATKPQDPHPTPSDTTTNPALQRRISFEGTLTRRDPASPLDKTPFGSKTAPLRPLSATHTGNRREDDERERAASWGARPGPQVPRADIESGLLAPGSYGPASGERFGHGRGDSGSECGRGGEAFGAAFLRGVNRGVERFCDRLVRRFHERVEGVDEGLLLPVRDAEREVADVRGVVVG